MKYGERLKIAMDYAKLKQGSLAGRVGLKQPSLSHLINNPNVTGSEYTVKLAMACGVRPQWLDTEDGEMIEAHQPMRLLSSNVVNEKLSNYELNIPDGYYRLNLLNTQASAGPGCMPASNEPETLTYIDVLGSYIRETLRSNPKKLQIITARGQSMRGVIEDGDILFVEPGNVFTSDGIYIIATGDWVRVKQLRLSVLENRVFIESTDGSKESISGDEMDTLHICGRVVGSWNLKRF